MFFACFRDRPVEGGKKENTFNKASIELTIKRGHWGLALSFTVQTFAIATQQLNYKYFLRKLSLSTLLKAWKDIFAYKKNCSINIYVMRDKEKKEERMGKMKEGILVFLHISSLSRINYLLQ